MEKIIVILLLILSSCSPDQLPEQDSRIKLVEYKTINARSFYIIKVDGIEYLTQSSGGFIPITKE